MQLTLAILLVIALLAFWTLNLISMPGNWLGLLATTVYWYFTPADGVLAIGTGVVVCFLALATLGEVIEFVAGSLGAAKAGGSKRAAILALIGSVAGAIAGAGVGSAVLPIVGTVLGALLLGGLGALMGAILGEAAKGRTSQESWQVGKAAFWGRIFGSLAKSVIGALAVAVVAVSLCC